MGIKTLHAAQNNVAFYSGKLNLASEVSAVDSRSPLSSRIGSSFTFSSQANVEERKAVSDYCICINYKKPPATIIT
jgi:hypothetical protein